MGRKNSLEGQFREGVRRPGEGQRMYVRVEPRDITPQNHLGRWTMGLQNNGSGQSGRLFSLCVNININMIWFCIHIKLVIWNIFLGPILKSMFPLCYIVMFTSMLWFVLSLKDILELWLKKNFKGKRERRNCLVGRLLFRLALPSWVTSRGADQCHPGVWLRGAATRLQCHKSLTATLVRLAANENGWGGVTMETMRQNIFLFSAHELEQNDGHLFFSFCL